MPTTHSQKSRSVTQVRNAILAVGFAFLLTACSSPVTPVPTDTTKLTATWTPAALPTSLTTSTPTVVPTAAPLPTNTPTPTTTPTPIPQVPLANLLSNYWQETSGYPRPMSPYFMANAPRFNCGGFTIEADVRDITFEGNKFKFCYVTGRTEASAKIQSRAAIATLPDPYELLDEKGEILTPVNVGSRALGWKKTDGRTIIMPFLFKRKLQDRDIAPVMKWGGGNDMRILTSWQIWILDRESGKPLQILDKPFVEITPDEYVVLDESTGYVEVIRSVGDALSPTGQRVGLQVQDPVPPTAKLEDIWVYGFPEEDAVKFQNILDDLKLLVPKWYDYLLSVAPFNINRDPTLAERGFDGSAQCCGIEGPRGRYGVVNLLEQPPNHLTDNIRFAYVLIHEATHVSDLRAGRFAQTKGIEHCRDLERSATRASADFLGDLIKSQVDDNTKHAAKAHLDAINSLIAGGSFSWNPACK